MIVFLQLVNPKMGFLESIKRRADFAIGGAIFVATFLRHLSPLAPI
jgi:hypothetical protein